MVCKLIFINGKYLLLTVTKLPKEGSKEYTDWEKKYTGREIFPGSNVKLNVFPGIRISEGEANDKRR